jgi:WD40-like Beta Propeller Repeat
MKTVTWLLAVCAMTACGHHGGGDDDDDTANATLSIDPPTSELVLLNNQPAHATFTATLTLADGTTRDVTADTAFDIDGSYGMFDANDLAISVAGKVEVFGTYRDKSGSAEVIARVLSVRIDPSLPPTTADMFNGTEDPALAPKIVYPPADAVMPRNLGDFEIHWTDAHANNVFEVSLRTGYTDVRVYVPGGNGLPETGPTASWSAFQATEWLAAVGLEKSVSFRVRGVNTAMPGKVGAVPAQMVQLSNEQMEGGLYYWAAASMSDVIGIFRHDMSRPGEPAEEFLTTNQLSGRCVACHVLSRDGTKMAVTYDGGDDPATMVDVGTATVAPSKAKWNFGTFTPDNTQFLAVEDGTLVVRDPATQAVLATMSSDISSSVSHPDLSPKGNRLVYATNPDGFQDWEFVNGQIVTRTYDQATMTFGPETVLVADGKNNFYPSWSPDGEWILFNRDATGDTSYDNTNGTTWVVKADGTKPPVQLAKADDSPGLTNSWARWAPFPQTLGDAFEPMFWVTMSSKRDFGVRLRNTGKLQRPGDANGPAKSAQIWMTPFFPNRAMQGQDPSAKAFRLPFQNLESSNHIAQWTERVVVIE